ncbi:MAG: ACT domain-containing protein [Intestinibacter bartlettii]|uniref:ACT domain-containing protein n=1 Tax=Intestinibacter bartlettii TaxID=261299 RepID=UPI0026F23A46|nr:ACT domain-containing protein [Intestinibacter bartlettii]MDO5011004.1 ACT domain-containing protein [Intestinibacter bartlettii]
MNLKIIDKTFAICKVEDFSQINLNDEFIFVGKTDNELSVVCEMKSIPDNCTHIDRGWTGFRIEGVLDFSLIGIISKLSTILAENKIGIFTISTYDTDYILVKKDSIEDTKEALRENGYIID